MTSKMYAVVVEIWSYLVQNRIHKTFSLCHFFIFCMPDTYRNNDIYQNICINMGWQTVQYISDPVSALLVVAGFNYDGLEDTQETGGINAHSPAHSMKRENKFASNIIEKTVQPQCRYCLWNAVAMYLKIKSVECAANLLK